jgi:hypothetical protein
LEWPPNILHLHPTRMLGSSLPDHLSIEGSKAE